MNIRGTTTVLGIALVVVLISAVFTTTNASGANRFVVYERNGEIYLMRSTDNGSTWKTPFNLSGNPGLSHTPTLAVSGTNVYVSWIQDSAEFPGSHAIYFRKSLNNGATWGAKMNLQSDGLISDTRCGTMPKCPVQIAASETNVYLSWYAASVNNIDNEAIYVKASNDNGATWKATKLLVDDNKTYFLNDLDVTAAGTSAFVLDGLNRVHKSSNGGDTWTLVSPGLTGDCSSNSFTEVKGYNNCADIGT